MLRVEYISAAQWNVYNEDGVRVGTLYQGVTQAWSAFNIYGHRIPVKGYIEYGGTEGPYTIANRLVNW